MATTSETTPLLLGKWFNAVERQGLTELTLSSPKFDEALRILIDMQRRGYLSPGVAGKPETDLFPKVVAESYRTHWGQAGQTHVGSELSESDDIMAKALASFRRFPSPPPKLPT